MSFKSFAKRNFTSKMLMTVGAPAAAVIAIAAIATGSNAAFQSSTQTPSSRWDSGLVKLDNDHPLTAVFAPSAILPGYTETHCITVSSSSTVPTTVQMYSNSGSTGPLGYELKFDIQVGSGGTNVDGVNGAPGSCTGFVPDATGANLFSDTVSAFQTHSSPATGLGPVELAPGATKTYQITATLPNDATSSGSSVSTNFAWTASGE